MAAGTPDTDTLIARLVAGAKPVRRLSPVPARLALWLAVQSALLIAAVLMLGLRPDLAAKLRALPFDSELVLLAVAGLASAVLALRAAVPGREPARALVAGAFAVVLIGIATGFAAEPSLGQALARTVAMGWPCAVKTLAVAALPWLVLMVAVRRGATLVPGLAGLLGGGATLCLAALAVRVTCPLDERWHLLGFHLGPVALGAALSLALGVAWLARWRRRP